MSNKVIFNFSQNKLDPSSPIKIHFQGKWEIDNLPKKFLWRSSLFHLNNDKTSGIPVFFLFCFINEWEYTIDLKLNKILISIIHVFITSHLSFVKLDFHFNDFMSKWELTVAGGSPAGKQPDWAQPVARAASEGSCKGHSQVVAEPVWTLRTMIGWPREGVKQPGDSYIKDFWGFS
jgi:hypothetical protein